MDDLYFGKDFDNANPNDLARILKYSILALILVGIFIICKNFKLSDNRQMRGRQISFV